jgi:hypothetical protein
MGVVATRRLSGGPPSLSYGGTDFALIGVLA